jgi:hypothetical protein
VTAAPEAVSAGPSKGRIVLARTLVALGALIGVLAALAGYIRWQALDTETFRGTASELIADDEVRNQVATRMVDELFANVDVAAELESVLPPNLLGLATPLAGASRQLAGRTAQQVLERPRVQELWVDSAVKTQEAFVRLLDDRGTYIQTSGGAVVLDLRPLVIQLGDEVAVLGRVATALPEDAGLVEIMPADKLESAQTATQLLNTVGLWLWVVPVALFGIAVAIVPGRRRLELRAVALAAIGIGLVILALRGIAGRYVVNDLVQLDSVRPAAQDAWNILTELLADGGRTILGLGLLLLFGVWLAGPSKSGTAARHFLAPYLARAELAWGAFAALAIAFLWWGPTAQSRRPLQALVMVLVLALAFEGLRRFTVREAADEAAAAEPPSERPEP